jgi:hypothetical protein
MNNLLVITGAGASHDVVHLPNQLVNATFQPPLTKDLFDDSSQCIADCLKHHHIAASVGYGLKLTLNSASPEESLESSLLKIKNSDKPTIKNQFWSIPIYLEALFTRISDAYVITQGSTLPSNYKVLINAIIESKYQQIIWINLNYDLLADKAIEITTNSSLCSLEDYINLKTPDGVGIKYTKPHGSVNWFRFVDNYHNANRQTIRLGTAHLENFENKLSEKIYMEQSALNYINNIDVKRMTEGRFPDSFYPAISVPLGKYKYIYPEHIDAIIPDLKNTVSVLCIGFSALDLDILDLIKDNIPEIKKLGIVNGRVQEGRETFYRIKEICDNVTVEEKNAIFDGGFSQFLSSGIISKWLTE